MTPSGTQRQKWLVCAFLATAVLAVFWQALRCDFLNVDDPDYVTLNKHVQSGLNWEGVKWAFTTGHAGNWHPLTWLSHMLDCQLYDLKPTRHHLTNLMFHLSNSVLLFLLLNRLTGSLWPSAWVAAIFALHPLRVESVVWVAERKDVLSTFFWMLTVGAYVKYAEEFKVQNQNNIRAARSAGCSKFKVFYALALVFFILGLMAKPMLVTMPFVLLLLDYWPLRRLEFGAKFSWKLVNEKIPFLALAASCSAVTFVAQNHSGAVTSAAVIPLSQRLANIPVAYMRYLGKFFWPSELGPFYGYAHWKFAQVAGAILLLGCITTWVVWQRRSRPFLAVGWFWFLGMLVPTIGLVQVGRQSMADRYTYLPSVGISIMAAWSAYELATRRPWLLKVAAVSGAVALTACAVLTPKQIPYWKNSIAFLTHAADVSNQDSLTYYNVGCRAMEQGNFPRAATCFERALRVAEKTDTPSFLAQVQNNLGCAYLEQGKITNAVTHFETAVKLQPSYPQAYYNMGRAFMTNHQPNVAVDCFQHALARNKNPVVLGALAAAYAAGGNRVQAVAVAQRALALALAQKNTKLAGLLDAQLHQYQNSEGGPHP